VCDGGEAAAGQEVEAEVAASFLSMPSEY
jgi:hypothetical protein